MFKRAHELTQKAMRKNEPQTLLGTIGELPESLPDMEGYQPESDYERSLLEGVPVDIPPSPMDDPPMPGPDELPPINEEDLSVLKNFQKLPKKERDAILMAYDTEVSNA